MKIITERIDQIEKFWDELDDLFSELEKDFQYRIVTYSDERGEWPEIEFIRSLENCEIQIILPHNKQALEQEEITPHNIKQYIIDNWEYLYAYCASNPNHWEDIEEIPILIQIKECKIKEEKDRIKVKIKLSFAL